MNTRFYVFIFISLSIYASVDFNPDCFNTQDKSLNQYLKTAAYNNPELLSAFERWKAALEVILEVNTLPDPQFSFSYFIVPIETRTGPQRALFALEQTFPWMGKLKLKGQQAYEAANMLRMEFEDMKLQIFYEVKKYYFEYAYLMQSISITKENIRLLRYIEGVARDSYAAGNAQYADIIRAQVELGQLQDRLRSLEDYIKPIVAKLNAAMYLPSTQSLPQPQLMRPVDMKISQMELMNLLEQYNPKLQSLKYLENKESYAVRYARKEYFPDFTIGFETIATGAARTPGISDSGKNPIIGKIAFNIPIWINKRRASVNKSEMRKTAAKNERNGIKETLFADLQLALYQYRDSIRKLNLYGDTLIPKAEEVLTILLKSFEVDTSNYLDLIDAERTLLELQLAYERSLADQAQVVARLETLVGTGVESTWKQRCSPVEIFKKIGVK